MTDNNPPDNTDDPGSQEPHRDSQFSPDPLADLDRVARQALAGASELAKSLGIGDSGHHDTARRTADERPIPRPWR